LLYQLSYAPTFFQSNISIRAACATAKAKMPVSTNAATTTPLVTFPGHSERCWN